MRRMLGAILLLVASLAVVPGRVEAATVDRIDAFGAARDQGSPELAPGRRPVDVAEAAAGGYWVATDDGGVQSFGGAPFHGSAGSLRLGAPVVGMAARPGATGYWLAGADGAVFSFGDAPFLGSLGGTRLKAPVVGMAATPDGEGYWLAAADGGVFSFGSATYAGGLAGMRLSAPIVDIAASPTGGYWLAGADGGVFSFGGAMFHGSAGALALRSPITSMEATPSGGGYWLAATDGGVFTYGNAVFRGAATGSGDPVTAMAALGTSGYWVLRAPSAMAPPLPPGSGSGRRIVYSNPAQRVWLVEADGTVVRSYLVSGKYQTPAAATYSVYSKSRSTSAGHDGITMSNMVRFARGAELAIGFHGIPRDANGRPLQGDDDLGGFRSAGCVRQSDGDAAYLYEWAPLGTTVVVLH